MFGRRKRVLATMILAGALAVATGAASAQRAAQPRHTRHGKAFPCAGHACWDHRGRHHGQHRPAGQGHDLSLPLFHRKF